MTLLPLLAPEQGCTDSSEEEGEMLLFYLSHHIIDLSSSYQRCMTSHNLSITRVIPLPASVSLLCPPTFCLSPTEPGAHNVMALMACMLLNEAFKVLGA